MRSTLWIMIVTIVGSSGIAWSQSLSSGTQTPPPEKIYRIDSVVVTAQYEPTHYSKSLFPISVISKAEFQPLSAFTVRELLFSLPALRINYNDVEGSGIEIDGISSEHVKLLWNGIPIEGRLKGVLDLSQIALHQIERVEVIKGPVSTFYGSNSIGGAVNIITRTPYPTTQLHPSISALVDSRGNYRISGGVQWSIGKIPISLAAGVYRFPGLKEQSTIRKYDFIPRTQLSGLLSIGFPVGSLYGTINSFYVWDDQQNALEPRNPTATAAYDEFYRTGRWINAVTISGDLSSSIYSQFVAAYTLYQRRRQVYQVDLQTDASTFLSERSDTTQYATWFSRGFLTFRQLLPQLQAHIGYELTYQTLETARILDRKQSVYEGSIFLSGQYTFQPWLTIQPSIRFGQTKTFAVPLTPTVNVHFQPLASLSLNLSYAEGFRSPTIKELYLYFPFYWGGRLLYEIVGNENLQPERSQHFSAQLRWNLQWSNWSIEAQLRGFVNTITDLIERVPTPDGDTITYRNRAEYRTHGGEINLRLQSSTTLFRFGFAITGRSNDGAEAYDEVEPYSYSPDVTGILQQWIPWIASTAWAQYRYVGKTPGYLIDTRKNEVKAGSIDPYTLLDFGIARTFWDGKIQLSVGVSNALDVRLVNDTLVKLQRGQTTPPPRPVSWGRTFFVKISANW